MKNEKGNTLAQAVADHIDSQKAQKKSQQAVHPYLNAREEWLERYGSYISRAAQWRTMAFVALGIAVMSVTGNVIQTLQNKVVPYVVEMDRQGNVQAVAKANDPSRLPEKVIQAEIANAIVYWRTVTVDTELQKRMIGALSSRTAGAATGMLKQWYEQNSPYQIAKSGKLVQVEIKRLPLPVSKDSYRVEWTETVRSHQGIQLDQQSFEAIATVELIAPEKEETIMKNPGGIYITNLNATKIIK
jgi:type IV secretion system protein VirB5